MTYDTDLISGGRTILSVGRCVRDAPGLTRGLARMGLSLVRVHDEGSAADRLFGEAPAAVLIDLDLPGRAPLGIADLVALRHPEVPVLFVARGGMFADGAIFGYAANAAAILPADLESSDLLEVLAFHAHPRPARHEPAPA